MSSPALEVNGVSVAFHGKTILSEVSLRVAHGEMIAVIGPNGAGKTTLLRALAGLLNAEGTIEIGGMPLKDMPLRERARRIAYLPQGHVFHWPLTVTDIVALGRLPNGSGADLSETDREAVTRAMSATGVNAFADRPVTTLSGGERARVALARVLATDAPVILADEPTASLDPRYQLAVLGILRQHAEQGGAVVSVLHDLTLAGRSADRVVALDRGRVVADGPPRDVLRPDRVTAIFGVSAEVIDVRGHPIVVPYSVTTPR
jgi:iron complex transport system ATP-binding protein